MCRWTNRFFIDEPDEQVDDVTAASPSAAAL